MGYRSEVYVGMAVKDFKHLREQVGKRDGEQTYIIDEWVIGEEYGETAWTYTDDVMKTLEHDSFHIVVRDGQGLTGKILDGDGIGDYVYFHIGGIKWYDTYEPIRVFHEAIETSSEIWGLIIIGEELDDMKSYGDPWDLDMNINRYVDMPGQQAFGFLDTPKIKTDDLPPECGFPVNWVRIG